MNINTEDTINIFTAVVTVASIIVSILPQPQEDSRLAKIYKLIDILALNILNKRQ